MVFNSFDSKEDEFNAFRNYRLRRELESGNDNAKAAFLSKASIRSKLPSISMTRLTMDTVDHDLSEINLLLHKIMKSEDAREAYEYLSENGLLEEFFNQQDRFLKFFSGVKKIPIDAFKRYWSEPKGTIVPEQQQLIVSSPEQSTTESIITGHITEKGESIPIEFSKRVLKAETVLDNNKSIIQDIEAANNTTELRNLRPKLQSLKNAIMDVRVKKEIYITPAKDLSANTFTTDKSDLIEQAHTLIKELQDEIDQVKRGEALQASKAPHLERAKSQGLRLGVRLPALHNRYHQIGEKYINTKRLIHDGKLALYHPSNRLIGKSVNISSGMVELIKGITFDDHFNPHLHKQLSKDERQIFDDFMNTTRLNVNPKYRMHNVHNQEAELMHEYKKLVGEMQVGNNNNNLRQNLKKVISEMYKREMISDEDMKRALSTLF